MQLLIDYWRKKWWKIQHPELSILRAPIFYNLEAIFYKDNMAEDSKHEKPITEAVSLKFTIGKHWEYLEKKIP
jgi:hypothetical protein